MVTSLGEHLLGAFATTPLDSINRELFLKGIQWKKEQRIHGEYEPLYSSEFLMRVTIEDVNASLPGVTVTPFKRSRLSAVKSVGKLEPE